MYKLIDKFKYDLEMVVWVENIKSYLKEDEVFNCYFGESWVDLCQWLKIDINVEDLKVKQCIVYVG